MSVPTVIHAPDWNRELYRVEDLAGLLEVGHELTGLTPEEAGDAFDALLALGHRGLSHCEPNGRHVVVRIR